MGKLILSSTAAIVASFLACLQAEAAARPIGQTEPFRIAKVSLPGEGRGDYLAVDAARNRLFVTHTTAVHVLDLRTLKPVAEVTGLTYAHGVALDGTGRGYVTDGNSNSVVVFDPSSGRELKRIAVGEKPDSILFDPASAKLMVFNANSNSVSVIDPASQAVIGAVSELPLTRPKTHSLTVGAMSTSTSKRAMPSAFSIRS